MYGLSSKIGEFETASFKSKSGIIYTTTTKQPTPQYVGVGKQNTTSKIINVKKITPDNNDEKIVKKALGKYKWFNLSVSINEAYSLALTEENIGYLYFVISDSKSRSGMYSAVVYVSGEKSYLIKYNFVRDVERAADWPIYSLKYVLDINGDNLSEIVIQEIRERKVRYDIISYNGKEFKQMLNLDLNI